MRSEGHKLPDLTFITRRGPGSRCWILPDGCRRDLKVVSIPVVSGLALAGISLTPAASQSRLQSATALCATLQDAVRQSGGVLIYTGPYLHERYVPYCGPRQRDVPAALAARDNPRCFVGYRCAATGN
jgi:hypothetical protein